jgi:hypothetical protein
MMKELIEETLRENTYNREFSVEDFRKLGLHKYMHPNAIGVFFTHLLNENKIILVGMMRATHTKAHGRKISVWRWNTGII